MRSPELDPVLASLVTRVSGAQRIVGVDPVQELWSGYGQILRCRLGGAEVASVIVKQVRWPDEHDHPRGWSTDRSHQRKVRSYHVETHFYAHVAARCGLGSRVPTCLAVDSDDDGVVLVLEDLDDAGFAARRQRVTRVELDACLAWLAGFHATFLGQPPGGLWPVGTYWHLETRPDELAAMPDGDLKDAAAEIDAELSGTAFPTLVHGDAKVANFCFDESGSSVAAVDFQYVGGGCGMKDVAYFLSSCLDEDECERMADRLLDRYFELLRSALATMGSSVDADALEADWRRRYPLAWTDFSRFLQGWSPGHWKLHRYSARLEQEVLHGLERRSGS